MSEWAALETELKLWQDGGKVPEFWWRDDDAQTQTPALERLLDIAKRNNVPAHLSVIPKGLDPAFPAYLNAQPHAWVLQHGFQHKNHEPKGQPASEVGTHRELAIIKRDLATGWSILTAGEFNNLLPVLVPPWNRIGDAARSALPKMGYAGLSSYPDRGSSMQVPGLTQIDGHLDPIRWKKDRVFRGIESMVEMTLTALADRRLGKAQGPIGYLTHHLQTNDDIWEFSDAFLARLTYQDRTSWPTFAQMLRQKGALR